MKRCKSLLILTLTWLTLFAINNEVHGQKQGNKSNFPKFQNSKLIQNSSSSPLPSETIENHESPATIPTKQRFNLMKIVPNLHSNPRLNSSKIFKKIVSKIGISNSKIRQEPFLNETYSNNKRLSRPKRRSHRHYYELRESDVGDHINWVSLESQHLNYTLYGSNPGNIYTYPANNYEQGWNQHWAQFEVTGYDNRTYIYFQNRQNDNVLYADEEGHAYGGVLNLHNKYQHWRLYSEDKVYYFFKNRGNGKYLDSGEKDLCHSSRLCCCSTVTTSSKSDNNDRRLWKITPEI